ncbi:MAG TPA: DUF6152 family protein [Alphaproteobacteria bacterium]|jgi:hypothetical protein
MTYGLTRRRFSTIALAAGLAATPPGAALAHHGWGSYDSNKPLTLTGTVVECKFDNPHGELRLKTADKTWRVTLAPPYRMENRGLKQSMLPAGATVTVVGYPSKRHDDEMRAERITVDGKTVELR